MSYDDLRDSFSFISLLVCTTYWYENGVCWCVRNVFGPCKMPDGLERGGTLESTFLFLILLSCNILALLLLVGHCSHMDCHRDKLFFYFTKYKVFTDITEWIWDLNRISFFVRLNHITSLDLWYLFAIYISCGSCLWSIGFKGCRLTSALEFGVIYLNNNNC